MLAVQLIATVTVQTIIAFGFDESKSSQGWVVGALRDLFDPAGWVAQGRNYLHGIF